MMWMVLAQIVPDALRMAAGAEGIWKGIAFH